MGDAKNTISELTRRYHELELELRRLENEREELTAAYKEAEAVIIQHLHIILILKLNIWLVFFYSCDCDRVAKLRNNAPNVWPPNTINSVTKLNAVSPRRTKKLNVSGKRKHHINLIRKIKR